MRGAGILGVLLFGVLAGGTAVIVHEMDSRAEAERELKRRIARLVSDTRAARIVVDARTDDHPDGRPRLQIRWSPIGGDGVALAPEAVRQIEVVGEKVYFDAYQILFEGEDVQSEDPLRGKALTLFSRVYGEHTAPADGQLLELPEDVHDARAGVRPDFVPPAFRARGGEVGQLERELWASFWDLCRDAQFAKERGVRTVQGTAVSKVLEVGMQYTLSISPSGQIFFSPPAPIDPLMKRE